MSESDYAKTIGTNLKRIAYEHGKTQSQIAKELKINKATLSSWMNGTRIPRMDKIDLLCHYFNVTRAQIMEPYSGVQADGQASEYHPDLSERELSHLTMYRTLSDPGKDRVDAYTEKVQSVEAEESDQQIVETFQKRFVARNGNKNLTPDQMRAIIDILDNQ